MPGLTNAYEAAVLNYLFSKAALAQPTIHVGLFTTLPADDGTGGVEVTGGSYARVATVAADWNTAVAGAPTVLTNASVIAFPQATAAWGDVVGFGLFDAATVGNLIVIGVISPAKTVSNGDTPDFAAGDLQTKLGDPADTF